MHALLEEPRIEARVAEDGKPYFFDETLTDLRRPLLDLQSALPPTARGARTRAGVSTSTGCPRRRASP